MIEKESSILLKSNQLCEKCGHRSRAIWTTNEHCYSCLDHTTKVRTFHSLDLSKAKSLEWDGNLPADYGLAWPPDNYMKWLKRYDVVSQSGWSATLDRLVFPIYYQNELRCYQARALDRKPKWITCSPDYAWGKRFPFMLPKMESHNIILCEDIISCYRIFAAGFSAVALLGCHANKSMLNFILRHGTNLIIWMDGDKAGVKAGDILETHLRLVANIKRIKTCFDPKEYTIDEIQRIVYELN